MGCPPGTLGDESVGVSTRLSTPGACCCWPISLLPAGDNSLGCGSALLASSSGACSRCLSLDFSETSLPCSSVSSSLIHLDTLVCRGRRGVAGGCCAICSRRGGLLLPGWSFLSPG